MAAATVNVRHLVDDVATWIEFSTIGRAMTDGTKPEPGGWNRFQLVFDLAAEITCLGIAGVSFRNEIFTGPGGSQILLVDPSGKLIELFQPAQR